MLSSGLGLSHEWRHRREVRASSHPCEWSACGPTDARSENSSSDKQMKTGQRSQLRSAGCPITRRSPECENKNTLNCLCPEGYDFIQAKLKWDDEKQKRFTQGLKYMFELLHLILFLKSTSNSKYFNVPEEQLKKLYTPLHLRWFVKKLLLWKVQISLWHVWQKQQWWYVTKAIFLFYRSSGGCERVTCLFFGGFFFWHWHLY